MKEQKPIMLKRREDFQIVFAKVSEATVNRRCKSAGSKTQPESRSHSSKSHREILHLPSQLRTHD